MTEQRKRRVAATFHPSMRIDDQWDSRCGIDRILLMKIVEKVSYMFTIHQRVTFGRNISIKKAPAKRQQHNTSYTFGP